jgi:hypothetical protein
LPVKHPQRQSNPVDVFYLANIQSLVYGVQSPHSFVPAVERRDSCTNYKMTARITSIPLYSEIVRENAQKMASVEVQIIALKNQISKTNDVDAPPDLISELIALEDNLAKHASIVIVFSAIAIESYFYDYAARHLSDNFVQNYLDKLDMIGKLVVIPRLITGKELPRNKKWFSLAKNIVKARNLIVHSKSSDFPTATTEGVQQHLKKIESIDNLYLQSAREAIELLDILVVELSTLNPDEAIWVEGYLAEKSRLPLEAK